MKRRQDERNVNDSRVVTTPRRSQDMKFPVIASALALGLTAQAQAAQVLGNSGFEADGQTVQSPDAIASWSASEEGIFGGVLVESGTVSPVSGEATAGAASGHYYGLIDLIAPSRAALSQSFTLGAQDAASASLSLDLFVHYVGAETSFSLAALGLSTDAENVQVRVDILKAGASAFSTDATDVLYSLALSPSLLAAASAYTHYEASWSNTGLLAGQTYTLRIAAANTLGSLQVGVDNVALQVSPVPEPQSLALILAGLGVAGTLRARRR